MVSYRTGTCAVWYVRPKGLHVERALAGVCGSCLACVPSPARSGSRPAKHYLPTAKH